MRRNASNETTTTTTSSLEICFFVWPRSFFFPLSVVIAIVFVVDVVERRPFSSCARVIRAPRKIKKGGGRKEEKERSPRRDPSLSTGVDDVEARQWHSWLQRLEKGMGASERVHFPADRCQVSFFFFLFFFLRTRSWFFPPPFRILRFVVSTKRSATHLLSFHRFDLKG